MTNRETLKVYDTSAKKLESYFAGIGSRVWDIEKAFDLAGAMSGTADVLELGCGAGRDAREIIPRSKTYLGVDYSKGMIDLARENIPSAKFYNADIVTFDYPLEAYDVVFAFAVILHLDKTEFSVLLSKIASSLKPGGILYISSKQADEYKFEYKHDQFGQRLFYF